MPISQTPLAGVSAGDAMHTGILTVGPETPLSVVARLMAERRVHAVGVSDSTYTRRPEGIVTALDVAVAVASGKTQLAVQDVTRSTLYTVRSDEGIERAAHLMAEHRVEHLIVVDRATARAEGILSVLDIAAALGGVSSRSVA